MSDFLPRCCLFYFLFLTAFHAGGQTVGSAPLQHSPNKASMRLERLPLAFEPNVGQAAAGTDYLVRTGAMQAELSVKGMLLSLPSANALEQQVSIRIKGGSANARPDAADRLRGESNYLLGKDASAWHRHVQRYGRVTYAGVYRGIDLTYYGNGSQVEHDFIVHPGASPSSIRLQFDGASKVEPMSTGDLRIALTESAVTLRRPTAYQIIGGLRRPVPVDFTIADGTVGFKLGRYEKNLPLVIDPVLDYATFLGNASVYVTGVAVDAAGDTYITGEAPVAFPASTGSATCSRCVTAANKLAVFVTKLNPAGTAVMYSTFLGGSVDPYNNPSVDQSTALTIDASGDAIVAGSTSSTDFPSKNPISSAAANFDNGFVLSLSPDGASLNFSSRLGGGSTASMSDMVYPESVTTDAAGNIYVAGLSQSTSLPTTPGSLHAFSPSNGDTGAFLLKLSPGGALGYGAIIGEVGSGSGISGPTGLAVDAAGVIVMAGTVGQSLATGMTTWPITRGAYHSALSSSGGAFVTRISADGSTVLSSTVLGPASVAAMTLTPTNDVLIAGTADDKLPLTPDAYSSSNPSNTAGYGFFAKVSQDGTQLLYSSLFGPNASLITISGIGRDPSGNVWLAGTTQGPLPSLVDPLQSVIGYQFSGTGFIAQFDPPMHNLLFSSYVNGTSGYSEVKGLAIDATGLAHVAGIASQDFPTTPGAALGAVTPPPPNYFYNYGFAALIDASKPGGSLCFANPSSPTSQVGTTGNGSFDLVNCGNGPLTISSVQLASPLFVFASGDTCTGPLAAGSSCTLAYTFTPQTSGNFSATVAIGSDAPLAANMETIYGTGTIPAVSLIGRNSFAFDPQVLGTPAQYGGIILQSAGTAPLIVDTTRTTLTGPFSITFTTCSSAPLSPKGTCGYGFSFNPKALGPAAGVLTVYTNDPSTPTLTVPVTGSAVAAFPVPTAVSLTPATISLDGGPITVGVNGANIFPQSTVLVNGVSVPVTSENNSGLSVTVDPATLGALGEFPVQVINPAPGGGVSNVVMLTAFHVLNLNATKLVYEPVSKLMYAAIPANSSVNPNTIISIDPVTEKLGTPIPVLINPTGLALSDDGHYLYVAFQNNSGASRNYNPNGAMLQRIDLTAGAVDRTFTLPNSSTGIMDMHVVPGSPQRLVASLSRAGSLSENGVALFNDAGLVQYTANDYPVDYSLDNFLFTSDPATFYGYPFNSASNFFNTASVSATQITPVSFSSYQSCCDQVSGSALATDGTLLYTNSGQVWDPKARKLLGRYDSNLIYEAAVTADSNAGRTFILDGGLTGISGSSGEPQILGYDPATFRLAGVLPFSLPNFLESDELLRWGADGFAFRSNFSYPSDLVSDPVSTSQIILVRSSLATPSAAGVVTITSLSPTSAAEGSAPLTITVNGSGFASDATVLWNGLARPTSFVSAAQLTATIASADLTASGTAQVSVSSGGSVSTGLPFFIGGGAVSLSTRTIAFPAQAVAVASSAQTVTVQNTGGAPLTGLSFSLAGAYPASFAASSTCRTTLAAGSSCTLNIVFTPTADGSAQASLLIADSAPDSPQAVSLSGTGAIPTFTLSNQSLSFGSVPIGSTAQQTITLRNSGSVALPAVVVAVSGQSSTDFPVTSACPANLSLNATCDVTASFKPAGSGQEAAILTVSIAGAAAQTVSLAGNATAPDFVLPPPTGASTVAVPAGQPATFNFGIGAAGAFTGTVTMSCANLPMYATCTFTPSSFTVGSAPTPVSLSIATQQTVAASVQPPSRSPRWPACLPALALLFALPVISRSKRKHLNEAKSVLRLLTIFLGCLWLNGCGGPGGVSSSTVKPPAQAQTSTPPGTYTIMVVATSGAVSHSDPLTLVVQ